MLNAVALTLTLAAAAFLAVSNDQLRSDDVLDSLRISWRPQSSDDHSHQDFPVFKLRLVNLKTSQCLDASDVKVFTRSCNKANIPMWEQILKSQSLKHIGTGKCLEMDWFGHGRVYPATCNRTNTQQQWDLSSQYIRNIQNDICLNENAQVAPCRPEDNMRWKTQKFPN